MAYIVSKSFRDKEYSGESEFKGRLVIGDVTVPNDQLSKIEIEDYIFDSSSSENNGVFYIGTFIAQKVSVQFKNLDGIDLHSGDNARLYISQYVDNNWVEIPMGVYLVDDLAENYQETCKIDLLDYSVKFKKNIDYSPCFIDGQASLNRILEYICEQCEVQLGDYPELNGNVETGQYDSTISGKRWISWIAETKGCNAKIDRYGVLQLIPLNQKIPEVNGDTIENILVSGSDIPVTLDISSAGNNVTFKGETTQTQTTASSNLFDELYYNNESIYTQGIYKYTKARISGNRVLYFKAQLKSGKTAQNGVYIALSDSAGSPHSSGKISAYAIRNGVASVETKDFTGINDLYINIYPNDLDISTIFDNYNLWVYTEAGTSYEPFVPDSPSPYYEQPISVVTGGNVVSACGKNIYPIASGSDSYNNLYYKDVEIGATITSDMVGKSLSLSFNINISSLTTSATGMYASLGYGEYSMTAVIKQVNFSSVAIGNYVGKVENGTITSAMVGKRLFMRILGFNQRATCEFTYSNLQLEYGSQATTYEEYKGHKYEINLGKNLAYTGWTNDFISRINDSSKASLVEENNRSCLKFNANAGYQEYDAKYMFKTNWEEKTRYTISLDIKGVNGYSNMKVEYTDGTTSNIPNPTPANTWQHVTLTTTNNKTIKYIRANWSSGDTYIDLNTFQIEKNVVETSYSPYITPIELCKIGTSQDIIFKNIIDDENYNSELDLNTWYIKKEIGKVVLDGSESYSSSGGVFYTTAVTDYATSNNIPKSNYFIGYSNVSGSSNAYNEGNFKIGFINVSGSTTPRLYFRNDDISSATNFKTWVQSNNIIVYYRLATPTYTKVNGELLKQIIDFENTMQQSSPITIDALQSASWKIGEKYEISKVLYDNGVIAYSKGYNTNNTLFLRQDNPFILNQDIVDNIYNDLLVSKEENTTSGYNIDLNLPKDLNYGNFTTYYGNTTQETTDGNNLLNRTTCEENKVLIWASGNPNNETNSLVSDYIAITKNQSIRMNYNAQIMFYDSNKDYLGCLQNGGTTIAKTTGSTTKSFTTPNVDEISYVRFGFRTSANNNVDMTQQNIMVNKGTTLLPYEPYTYGATPNPNYPQPINVVTGGNTISVVGKNLFSGFIKGYGLNATNGLIASSATSAISEAIPVDFDTYSSYYIKGLTNTISSLIAGYNENFEFIGRTGGTTRTSTEIKPSNMTSGTPQGTGKIKYIIVTQYKTGSQTGTIDDIDNLQVMLNTGSTPLTYEAYIGQKYEVNLGKNLLSLTDGTYSHNSVTAVVSNGVMTISGTANGTSVFDVPLQTPILASSGRLMKSLNATGTYAGLQTSLRASNGTTSVGLWTTDALSKDEILTGDAYKFRIQVNSGISVDCTIKPQVEHGITITPFSPYKTPIELNKIGTYQDTIFKSSGDNLWNTENQQLNKLTYDSSTGLYSATDNDNRSSLQYKIQQYNNNSAISGTTTSVTINATGKYVLTTTIVENCNRIRLANNGQSQEFSLFINDIESLGINVGDTITLGFNVIDKTIGASKFNEVMLVKGTYTSSTIPTYEPYGTDWYIKKEIGKVVLDGSESGWNYNSSYLGFRYTNTDMNINDTNPSYDAICSHFLVATQRGTAPTSPIIKTYNSVNDRQYLFFCDGTSDLATFKTWLSNNTPTLYFKLLTPTYTKITDEELLSQIEALENVLMYQDTTHILQSNSDLPIYLDLTYNSSNQFEMYSLQTRNYGDISLDAWDYITYTLGENAYKTYNNRKLTFEMSIMSDTNTQISNKQQEVTTNIIGGSTETQTRKLRTEVNALDNSITMEVENINIALNNQSAKISGLEINADAISQSVSSLQTLTNDQYNELSNNLDSYQTVTDNELNAINNKFSDYATTSDLATIQRSVNQVTTDTYTKTEINSFLVDGSVKKIQTTSLTADESGLTFEKTNAPTKSNINEQGVTVMDNSDNPILRAVYDDEIKNSVVETYRHQVHEYFIMGSHSRFEDYENGTGCFYI